jgi:hypothetical protein
MWFIVSNGGFNVGFCGSNTLESFVFFLLFSGMIIPHIFGLCQELYWPKETPGNTKTKSILIAIFILGFLCNIFFFAHQSLGFYLFLLLLSNMDKEMKFKLEYYWFSKKSHLAANLISVIGLIGWEFAQMSGKLRFDWNDILWTFIGVFIFQFIWLISPQKFKER